MDLRKTYWWDIECLSPWGPASIKVIHRGGPDWLCGAWWKSISDDGFIDGIKSHVGLCGGAMLDVTLGGGRGRHWVKAKGRGGGVVFARKLAHRQALHVALSRRTTCRHLHLERSIPRHKQLRGPLENSIYWFGTCVDRRKWNFWYSLLKSALNYY